MPYCFTIFLPSTNHTHKYQELHYKNHTCIFFLQIYLYIFGILSVLVHSVLPPYSSYSLARMAASSILVSLFTSSLYLSLGGTEKSHMGQYKKISVQYQVWKKVVMLVLAKTDSLRWLCGQEHCHGGRTSPQIARIQVFFGKYKS